MARLVVLSFEDNDEADRFVNQAECSTVTSQDLLDNCEVVGLFAFPTQFCENSGSGGCARGNKRIRGWTQGKKYGWWVCSVCHKPSGYNREALFRPVVSQGVNLRAPAQKVNLVTDEGWGVSGRD